MYIVLVSRRISRRVMVRRVGKGAWDLWVRQRVGREERGCVVDMVVGIGGGGDGGEEEEEFAVGMDDVGGVGDEDFAVGSDDVVEDCRAVVGCRDV